MSFKVTRGETALGTEHKFHGPGLPQYANGVHFLQVPCEWALQCLAEKERADYEADTILRLLQGAFEAGKEEARREIRHALGVFK